MEMKKYEAYKDSGVDWIGEIPKHWEAVLFKRVIQKIKDGTHGTYQRIENGKPFLSAKNVYDWGLELSEIESQISEEDFIEITKNGFPSKDDLLITCVGTIGRSYVYDLDYPMAFQRSVAFIRLEKKIALPKFYKYYVESSLYQDFLKSIAKTSAQSGVYMGDLMNSISVIAPIVEQEGAIRFLDHKTSQLDTLISKKEKLIELLQEERTAIINHAVTKGLNPNAPMRDSGIEWLGDIPEHWEVKKIKHVNNKIGSGVTPKGGAEVYQDSGIPLLRSQNVYFDGFHLDEVAYISEEVHNSMSGSKVYPLDVLINITGGSIGRCYYVTEEFKEANVNQHVCIVRPNEKIDTVYLYNLLRSDVGQLQIDLCQSGGNRESLNFEQLKNFFIPLPSIKEQNEILESLHKKEEEINMIIDKTQQEIELLKEYKTALISEVVTGKVDVRNEIVN